MWPWPPGCPQIHSCDQTTLPQKSRYKHEVTSASRPHFLLAQLPRKWSRSCISRTSHVCPACRNDPTWSAVHCSPSTQAALHGAPEMTILPSGEHLPPSCACHASSGSAGRPHGMRIRAVVCESHAPAVQSHRDPGALGSGRCFGFPHTKTLRVCEQSCRATRMRQLIADRCRCRVREHQGPIAHLARPSPRCDGRWWEREQQRSPHSAALGQGRHVQYPVCL